MVKRVLVVMLLVSGCGSRVDATQDASTSEADTSTRDDAPGFDVFADPDGCTPAPPPAPPYGAPTDASPPEVAPPPSVACTARDVGPCDEPVCEPPPSRCADGFWLAYYADGACVEGSCHWSTKLLHCDRGCSGGGCLSGLTK